jgi:signal transduction histidine kinase
MYLWNWSIRTRILALFLIPLLSLIGIYVFAALTTISNANTLARSTQVRNSIADPIGFFGAGIQQERLLAAIYLASPSQRNLAAFRAQELKTDQALSVMRAALDSPRIQGVSSPAVRAAIKTALSNAAGLPALRARIQARNVSRSSAEAAYTDMIGAGYQTIRQATLQMPSAALVDQASSVLRVADAVDLLLQAQALLVGDETARSFPPADQAKFADLTGGYHSLLNEAIPDLDPAYRPPFSAAVGSPAAASLGRLENQFLSFPGGAAQPGRASQSTQSGAAARLSQYNGAVTAVATALGIAGFQAGNTLASALHAEAGPIDLRLAVVGGLGLLAIIVSVAASVWIGTGLIRQLRGLRHEALELARRRLPSVMARLSAGEDIDIRREARPLATSRDEIGQVGQAFNLVQRSALEAAANQARLREGVSTVFRNLARRSQSLLHQQLSLLDVLEQRTNDPAELERLFRIDHLTTRMRRHAEGLVVLAGDQPSRDWTNPVPMVDVLRGAVAEVVDYTRIRVVCTSRSALVGHAVADVIHLLAELADNATVYSSPDTSVRVYGTQADRGFAVEVEDRGVGMSEETIARLNATLADPPPFNPAESQRLGLYVAARLARRHGIRIILRESPFGGATAIVLIPLNLIVTAPKRSGARAQATASANTLHGTSARSRTGRHASRDPEPASGEPRPDNQDSPATATAMLPVTAAGNDQGSQPQPAPAQSSPLPVPSPQPAADSLPPSGVPGWDIGNLPERERLASLPPHLRNPPTTAPRDTGDHSVAEDNGSWPGQIRDALTAMRNGTERGREENARHSQPGNPPQRPDYPRFRHGHPDPTLDHHTIGRENTSS